jgi:hypothetical protein
MQESLKVGFVKKAAFDLHGGGSQDMTRVALEHTEAKPGLSLKIVTHRRLLVHPNDTITVFQE